MRPCKWFCFPPDAVSYQYGSSTIVIWPSLAFVVSEATAPVLLICPLMVCEPLDTPVMSIVDVIVPDPLAGITDLLKEPV